MHARLPAALAVAILLVSADARAQQPFNAQWMWFDAGKPAEQAPAGKVWFRRTVRETQPATGAVRVIADDRFTLWVNGEKIGEGGGDKLHRFGLSGIVGRGTNVIAVEAENESGKAGLFVDGEIRNQRGQYSPFDGGPQWKATNKAPQGDAWLKPEYDASGWKSVKVIGPHQQSPWSSIALEESYLDRFFPAGGFEIERIAEPELVGSLVSVTWGDRGRLMAGRERGPILSVIDDDGDGIYDRVVEYSNEVKNCQGLCTVGDDLYAVGNGPQGAGIYRLPDRNHDDKADKVVHVYKHKGGMAEHGPHNVVFGPDGWLYNNMGNHAWVTAEPEPTTPVRDTYEGHLLRPKFEDARGHARGKKAPGGTIWRFSRDGKRWWLETAGFRNEYDFAFNSKGDVFSFDSDMEWDVGMPWYRPVRVNHCPPGAEFGWRSGCAKWPPYYFDSLPATVDIGRGSPTGVVFYEHRQFPEKYRGAFIICDWSMGRIMAVYLDPEGASFDAEYENLVTGNPLNVSDIEVDRDGSIVFSTGGRGTEGGLYRVTCTEGNNSPAQAKTVDELLDLPQLQAAWARDTARKVKAKAGDTWEPKLTEAAKTGTPAQQRQALTLLSQLGPKPGKGLLIELTSDDDPTVRAFATWLLGDHGGNDVKKALTRLLDDPNATVRRRACEAFVRSGIEAPAERLVELLGSEHRFLRFAARLSLERVPPQKWKDKVLTSDNPDVVTYGLHALWRLEALPPEKALQIEWELLDGRRGEMTTRRKLDALRMIELALIRGGRHPVLGDIAQKLAGQFPTGNTALDSESAKILAELEHPDTVAKVIQALEKADSQKRQIDYALTLRYCKVGWNFQHKRRLLDWYESTETWEGGHSFGPYLENIVGATLEYYTPEERKKLILEWQQRPYATGLLIARSSANDVADFETVLNDILSASIDPEDLAKREKLVSVAIDALGRGASPSAQAILRNLFERFPDYRSQLARILAKYPNRKNWPYLIRSLRMDDPTTLQLAIRGLVRTKQKPKDPKPEDIRAIILAGLKLEAAQGGKNVVRLLRQLTGEKPGTGNFEQAVAQYQDWYGKNYPDAPPAELPQVDRSKAKYTFEELVHYIERQGAWRKGDPQAGKKIFEKANCAKCHRFGEEGETIGPDLTSVRRRFQRREIIESLVYPSQVVSDQYRMVTVLTTGGLVHTGMQVTSNDDDKLALVLPDATRLEIPKEKVAMVKRSQKSVMPVGVLKELSKEQIADLFAFLETSKFNAVTPRDAKQARAGGS